MIYAKRNIRRNNIQMYIFLLHELIDNDNQKVQPLFISLYQDTKNIVTKTIPYYKIANKDFVPVISYLAKNHSDYFKTVNTESLVKSDYSKLKTYLEEAVSII